MRLRSSLIAALAVALSAPAVAADITLSGPSDGLVGADLVFLASVPAGVMCGAQDTSQMRARWEIAPGAGGRVVRRHYPRNSELQVTVRWSVAGEKILTVDNAECVAATLPVLIEEVPPPPPPDPLVPRFHYSPLPPRPEAAITFDASASGGSPSGFEWDFGDGTQATGAIAQKVYALGGAYDVRLRISGGGESAELVD